MIHGLRLVQESWCHDEIDINCFSLPNYTLINSYRRLTAHGGLIMYVHDDFAFKEIYEKLPITHTSTLFESVFVEVWRKSSIYKKYVIGNIYRLPSYISDDINPIWSGGGGHICPPSRFFALLT